MEKAILNKSYDSAIFKSQIIDHWKPASEVWAFQYGDEILGSLTIIGSTFITYSFRKFLNLRPYARLTCYSPAVGLAALGCYAFQTTIVSSDILAANACPLCIQTRSSFSQALIGVGFPLLISPMVCFYLADKLLTYPIPPLTRAPREVFNLYQKIIMPRTRPILIIGAMNMAVAFFITYQKQKEFYSLESSLLRKEDKRMLA